MNDHKKPPRDLMRPRPQKFGFEQFISDVCNDKYILIVGGEVILNKELFGEVDGNVDKYILASINNSLQTSFQTLNAFIASRPSFSTPNELSGADILRNLVLPKEENEEFDYFIETEYISPELSNMLRLLMFRFVMTTTIDDSLERLMKDIWGKRLRVVNIADTNDWMQFQKELSETIDTTEPMRTVYNYNRPTLIYIFGKVEEDTSKDFLKTENDAIEFIEKWIKAKGAVIKFISEKRILALGCKFDDWYFRFFWYIFKRDFDKLGEGEVAISLDDQNSSEHNLKEYLKRKSIYIHPDARKFMTDINSMLTLDTKCQGSIIFHDILIRRRGCGEIFLSYCSRDFAIASRLFLKLTDMGYQVWFDNESLCGGNYENEIISAINNASVIITLLTPNIADDLTVSSTDHYYIKEWMLAVQTGNERLIPVAVNGYNLREIYHTEQYQNIVGSVNGVDLMIDGFKKLIDVIENIRKKVIR